MEKMKCTQQGVCGPTPNLSGNMDDAGGTYEVCRNWYLSGMNQDVDILGVGFNGMNQGPVSCICFVIAYLMMVW
uniref:Uncharacterized protein n=2 Tax=Musa acuminata subsp. malaccensis TaxID=214687 RepID=A0A804IHG6_MUSAM